MKGIIENTGWKITRMFTDQGPGFIAIIEKGAKTSI
jgi:hypothetical protein